MRIGVVVPELMGHLNPAIELVRELNALGHYAVLMTRGRPGYDRALSLGVDCITWALETPGREELSGGDLGALAAYLRAANAQLMSEGLHMLCFGNELDALVIDETLQGACLVAARRGMPYATFCAALPMAYDPAVPPPIFGWQPARSWLGRLRDKAGWAYFAWVFRRVRRDLERYRVAHGIPLFDAEGRSVYVGRAQVAQLPAWLDFPRVLPPPFLATGAWVTRDQEDVPFPWFWLDAARRLVYVCMGTITRGEETERVIRNAVEEAALVGSQVVVSLGGHEMAGGALGVLRELYAGVRRSVYGEEDRCAACDVLVVPWAPHYALIARADTFCGNGGFNTVLACVDAGTPVELHARSFDHQGVAARILFASARHVL